MKEPLRSRLQGVLAGVVLLILLAAVVSIFTPSLMRSRMAALEASRMSRHLDVIEKAEAAERKLTKTASLEVVVSDLERASVELQRKTTAFGGEFVNSAKHSSQSGELERVMLQLRVPAQSLEDFLKELRAVAIRVESEQLETTDVTTRFIDTEAKLRNLKAVEQQYFALLRQSRSVDDTLKITEKLNAARTEIDTFQGELNLLNKQVETSLVRVTMRAESKGRILGIYWRPWANFKTAAHDLLVGLASYVDVVVSFIVQLPLFILWFFTLLLGGAFVVRVVLAFFRSLAQRGWFRPRPTAS